MSSIPAEVTDPPTNSVATRGPVNRPLACTLPAKNVWMSPVMNVTSRVALERRWPRISRRSRP